MDCQSDIERALSCPAADAPELDVTGIDIGTINLAFCRIRICTGQPVIVWWQVIDLLGLEGGIARDACANLHKCLKPYLQCFQDCPLFAIEQQPDFAGTMKNVAHGIVAYLHTVTTAQCQTFMSSAQNKLKPFPEAVKEDYGDRKESAVEIMGGVIERRMQELVGESIESSRHQHFSTWFSGLKKKDDAADAWLHAYYTLLKQKIKPYQGNKPKTLSQMSKKQLEAELKKRNLPHSGNMEKLKKRLKVAKDGESGISSKSITQLRAELEKLNLDSTGPKKELVIRLYHATKKVKRPTKKVKRKSSRDHSPEKAIFRSIK